MTSPTPTGGATPRDLVLDMFGVWDTAGTCNSAWDHPATKLDDDIVNAACDALVADGLLVTDWFTQQDGLPTLTAKGRAALSAARAALASALGQPDAVRTATSDGVSHD